VGQAEQVVVEQVRLAAPEAEQQEQQIQVGVVVAQEAHQHPLQAAPVS